MENVNEMVFDYLGTDVQVGKPEDIKRTEEPINLSDEDKNRFEELQSVEEDDLSEEDKKFLEKVKPLIEKNSKGGQQTGEGDDDGDDGGDDPQLTDEEIEALRNKPEEELTDEEKQILEDLDKPFIAKISEAVGFQLPEGKEYSDDTEGLSEFAKDYANSIAEQEINNFMETNPEVFDFFEARKAGMSSEEYLQRLNGYEQATVKITDDTPEAVQEQVLRTSYAYKGYDKEDIDVLIQKAKDNGNLLEEATKGSKFVQKAYKEEMQAIKQQNEELEAERIKKNKAFWSEATKVIQSGNLDGAFIPETEREKFFNYLTQKDENGLTEKDKKRKALTPKEIMKIEWAIYNNFEGIGGSSKDRKKVSFSDMTGGSVNRKNRMQSSKKQSGGQAKTLTLKEMIRLTSGKR